MNETKLTKISEIENYSGVDSIKKIHQQIEPLRFGFYKVLDQSVGGDAPKDFIQMYQYGDGVFRKNPKTWQKYIAKVGHKWYPLESITEYLLNQIGGVVGLEMAKSELRLADGQIRFLSRYFLQKNEGLVHGAQIFSAFLGESNNQFVDEIENAGKARELFTFQFTKLAIEQVFSQNQQAIFTDFVRLLVFDALTGNNDRHFYNWGVITDIHGKSLPRFSPIYDTARGLFWNYSEQKIATLFSNQNKIIIASLNKYIQNSMPKTGWLNEPNLNHFGLVEQIFSNYPEYVDICSPIFSIDSQIKVGQMLQQKFRTLLFNNRFMLINECLNQRFEKLRLISKTSKQ
jgi:hypothetical protein